MRVLSFIMAMFLSIAVCFGQEFLHSTNYIYGYASDFNESKADSLALLSFSKCVHVSVFNNKEYVLNENHNGVSEEYKSNVKISSDVNVSGLKKYVDYNAGVYTVYYYFNKEKYFNEHMSAYDTNIDLAEKYKNSTEPHAKNFVLGYYYLAFEAISDELLWNLYPNMKVLKDGLIKEISEQYNHFGYLLSARNVGKQNPSGVLLIRDENAKTLPGFEYKKSDNSWDIPRSFCDIDGKECKYNVAKWAYVYTRDSEYRFLFEIKSKHGEIKINVPDEFYSKYLKHKNFYF